ncbi:hypothetical protein EDD36DRAFT_178176 [Exophiala viscosa]|uniref:Uncharacterized protein n=1 Tax=Exophiala viscosa TaxID=2486360 RepID=A0AAN6IH53_9EURO|nr:hypothetical protein EDD36DRAFT_178176 [Exophiala viscosa]
MSPGATPDMPLRVHILSTIPLALPRWVPGCVNLEISLPQYSQIASFLSLKCWKGALISDLLSLLLLSFDLPSFDLLSFDGRFPLHDAICWACLVDWEMSLPHLGHMIKPLQRAICKACCLSLEMSLPHLGHTRTEEATCSSSEEEICPSSAKEAFCPSSESGESLSERCCSWSEGSPSPRSLSPGSDAMVEHERFLGYGMKGTIEQYGQCVNDRMQDGNVGWYWEDERIGRSKKKSNNACNNKQAVCKVWVMGEAARSERE